jgi:hypothetical protein
MANTSNSNALTTREKAYYRQRQKNRVFGSIAEFFASGAERGEFSRKLLAEKLGKDPAQITRWFSGPSNLELDSISDILLAMDAEMDWRVVSFKDRSKPNYRHEIFTDLQFSISGTNVTGPTTLPSSVGTEPAGVVKELHLVKA